MGQDNECDHRLRLPDGTCSRCNDTGELVTLTAEIDQAQQRNTDLRMSLMRAGGALDPMLPLAVLMDAMVAVLAPELYTQARIKLMTETRLTEALEAAHKELRMRKLQAK